LLCVALVVLAFGIFGLYKVMTDAQVAELKVAGTRTAAEERQVMQYVSPIVTENYLLRTWNRFVTAHWNCLGWTVWWYLVPGQTRFMSG
jgi:hypothetical protein